MKKKLLSLLIFALIYLGAINAQAATQDPRLIPSVDVYQRFLLNKWKPNALTLLVFKDPFCPYCIRDLKKRSQLDNYNVFLFWAPILSDASVTRVNEYFQCESLTSEQLINAVIGRQSPRCGGPINETLLALNNKIVANYNPNSVPAYWLGGRKVSLSTLNLNRPTIDVDVIAKQSSLAIDWSRYQSLSVNLPLVMRHNVAIVLPGSYHLNQEVLSLLSKSTQYNWYLFSDNMDKLRKSPLWCERHPDACSDQTAGAGDLAKKSVYSNQEFRLLTGLENVLQPVFLLEGKVLSDRQRTYLIPKEIQKLILSTLP